MHAERTVKVTRHEGGDGSYSETVQSNQSSQQSSSTSTRVTVDNESLLGECMRLKLSCSLDLLVCGDLSCS